MEIESWQPWFTGANTSFCFWLDLILSVDQSRLTDISYPLYFRNLNQDKTFLKLRISLFNLIKKLNKKMFEYEIDDETFVFHHVRTDKGIEFWVWCPFSERLFSEDFQGIKNSERQISE